MLKNILDEVNTIYRDEGFSLDLKVSDYDAIVVKKIAKTEVLRRNSHDDHTGVLNNSLCSRVDPTLTNGNGVTHFFLPKSTFGILPPLLSNIENMNYALTIPVTIPFITIHLMLKNIPTGYYDTSKVDVLKNEYSLGGSMVLQLSAKETSGSRLMFASKEFIHDLSQRQFFMELKSTQFENDYMILLKYKSSFRYLLLFIPQPLGDAKNLGRGLYNISSNTPVPSTYFQSTGAKNLIVLGSPGTGKSNWIKENFEGSTESKRVTFHPEYTYNEFIGSLRPVNDPTDGVKYTFTPGPFTKILQLAYSNPSKIYTLIIEEINRANTAAVFGDVFQILDRNIEGFSDYGIENEEILNYINESLLHIQLEEIKLPPNLNLIATMNSADQGVFQMDTAFKRRWNIQYVPIEFDEWHDSIYFKYNNKFISAKNFITTLNTYLSENQYLQVNEDRLIGPYFLRREEAERWFDKEEQYDYYKKLFIYLWDDIARIDRNSLFKKDYRQFSLLCKAFEDGEAIFVEALHETLTTQLVDDLNRNNNGTEVDTETEPEQDTNSEADLNSTDEDNGELQQVQAANDEDDTHTDTSVNQNNSEQDNQSSPPDNL
ncbi:McrB family protein [Bacillus gaemokensis]|uniref:McrB family protein n=1 Tax=Bacillus gaemokensis TaxID=574375 RepID=UPI00068ACF9A|nr:AAA family ATPase [Bacillus gaemokensis]KYG30291.1 hypothetical protein AZF08_13190 [Bacillus gaemokensis]